MTETTQGPLLGLATTRELLDELECRARVNEKRIALHFTDLPQYLQDAFGAIRRDLASIGDLGLDYRTVDS